METIALTAPDISCSHCQATIERELGTMTGVQRVSVDIPARRVTVSFDPSQLSPEEIAARLDDEGYPVVG